MIYNNSSDFNSTYKLIKCIYKVPDREVHLASSRISNDLVVVKKINLDAIHKEEQQDAIREAKILKQLNHPNIIKYRDLYIAKSNKMYIIMEYADGGDLASYILQQARRGPLPESAILDMFVQICLAVKYMHDNKIVHRDIKSGNIFLTSMGGVKLGDFGISSWLNKTNGFMKSFCGTPLYLSPEIIKKQPYNVKTDIWSLGVVLYELCTFKQPFKAHVNDQREVEKKILRRDYEPIPRVYSSGLIDLVDSMLTIDFNRRPSIKAILSLDIMRNSLKRLADTSEARLEHVDKTYKCSSLNVTDRSLYKNVDQCNFCLACKCSKLYCNCHYEFKLKKDEFKYKEVIQKHKHRAVNEFLERDFLCIQNNLDRLFQKYQGNLSPGRAKPIFVDVRKQQPRALKGPKHHIQRDLEISRKNILEHGNEVKKREEFYKRIDSYKDELDKLPSKAEPRRPRTSIDELNDDMLEIKPIELEGNVFKDNTLNSYKEYKAADQLDSGVDKGNSLPVTNSWRDVKSSQESFEGAELHHSRSLNNDAERSNHSAPNTDTQAHPLVDNCLSESVIISNQIKQNLLEHDFKEYIEMVDMCKSMLVKEQTSPVDKVLSTLEENKRFGFKELIVELHKDVRDADRNIGNIPDVDIMAEDGLQQLMDLEEKHGDAVYSKIYLNLIGID